MSDTICTQCRGQSTNGCELCNPSIPANYHQEPFVCQNGCTLKIDRLTERNAELEAECERLDKEKKWVCCDLHPRIAFPSRDDCPACRADKVEATIKRVEGLPRYDRDICGDWGRAPDGCWISYDELQQALKREQE